jgi:hypothetical protein
MPSLETLVPALNAVTRSHTHGWWWLVLAIVVFAMIMPLAYLMGRGGGQPDQR